MIGDEGSKFINVMTSDGPRCIAVASICEIRPAPDDPHRCTVVTNYSTTSDFATQHSVNMSYDDMLELLDD